MPPKKQSLSDRRQRSLERERSRTRRVNETEEECSQRKENIAFRTAILRQNETEEERCQRRRESRERMAFYRENETNEESCQRREENAERMAFRRHSESEKETELRRKSDAEQKVESKRKPKSTHNIALTNTEIDEYYIGKMEEICTECRSLNFKDERPIDGKFNSCCHKGKVLLDPLQPYPELLKKLLTDDKYPKHKNFMENIRSYNSTLWFASMGATIRSPPGIGPYCFRIHGQIYHRVGSLHLNDKEPASFAQLYILDTDEALDKRMAVKGNQKCDPQLMAQLDSLIRNTSIYAKGFKMMRELELEEEQKQKKKKGALIQSVC
jgi:hypothetical protein